LEPHLPSASQIPERQAAPLEQVLPLGTPHRPSGPQAPPRHCAWAVHAASLGWPQRSSCTSQTPAAQTLLPSSAVQTPALWSASLGMAWPLASLVAQVRVPGTQ
jgi:hypothetical protein